MAQTRHCFVTEVKTEAKLKEYRAYHDAIFPEVAAGLRAAGITQLTIFLVPGTRTIVMRVVEACCRPRAQLRVWPARVSR